MSLTRRLAYIDTFVEKLNQVIANGCDGEPIWFPDNTTPIKFVVEMNLNEFTKILSALLTGADLSYPEQSHEVVWSFLRQVECPVSLCPDILDCLQAAFDELNAKLDTIQTGVTNITNITEAIQQTIEENGAGLPTLPTAPTTSAAYAGAVAVVEWMNATNLEIYAEAEASAADNASEVISVILRLFPKWSGNGVEEGAALGNAYFENQVEQYNSDYPDFLLPAACQLYCLITANSNVFSYDVWSDWLNELDVNIPDNAAATVFARYSPFRQTFLNQIAAFINGEQSLQDYFAELYNVYYAGTTNPIPVPETCECPPPPTRIPVIQLLGTCENGYSGDYGGTDIVDLGGGSWSITATLNATTPADYRITFKDTADRPFVLTAIEHTGSSGCWGWNAVSGGCYTSMCGGGTDANGIEITDYFVTGSGVFTMTFTMSEP